MAELLVDNGWGCRLTGLGKVRPVFMLSEKRITNAARQALRRKYGHHNVEVTCRADLRGLVWYGQCEIGGKSYGYRISTQ